MCGVKWVRAICVAAVLVTGLQFATSQLLTAQLLDLDSDPSLAAPPETDPDNSEPEPPRTAGQPAEEIWLQEVLRDLLVDLQSPDPAAVLDNPSISAASPTSQLAIAEDLPSASERARRDPPGGRSRADDALLFSGVDLWRNGFSGYGGIQWGAAGTGEDGLIVRLTMSQGFEQYFTPDLAYTTDIFRAALLTGWRFKRGTFELKLFAGPDFEHRNLDPDIIGQRWRGAHGGLRVVAESWAEPTPELMLASSLYVTSIASTYGFRAAAGWRLFDQFWLGPEVSGSRDEFSRQTRIGLHLTGLQLSALEVTAAAGFVSDSYGRSGSYMRMGAQLRP